MCAMPLADGLVAEVIVTGEGVLQSSDAGDEAREELAELAKGGGEVGGDDGQEGATGLLRKGFGTGRKGRDVVSGVEVGVGYAGLTLTTGADDEEELEEATARGPCSARIFISNSATSRPWTFKFHSR